MEMRMVTESSETMRTILDFVIRATGSHWNILNRGMA